LANDDKHSMRTLTQAFGESIWEYSVIALTFANEVDCSRRDDRDHDTGPEPALDDEEGWKALEEKRFKGRLKIREEELKHFLTKEINVNPKIVKSISVVPVGDYRKTKCNQTPYHLPDRDNWFITFWESCCLRIKDKYFFLQINKKRMVFQGEREVSEQGVVNLHNCNITITNSFTEKLAEESVRRSFPSVAGFFKKALKTIAAPAIWLKGLIFGN
jgi:hypothetical protein